MGQTTSAKVVERRLHGFTLVELLAVIAIISVLLALLLPAVQAARESARQTTCQNHLKQLALGLLSYESNFSKLPSGGDSRTEGFHPMGWVFEMFPFVEEQNRRNSIEQYASEHKGRDKLDQFQPWRDPIGDNRLFTETIELLICPSSELVDEPGSKDSAIKPDHPKSFAWKQAPLHYRAVAGTREEPCTGVVFPDDGVGIRLSQVLDGTSSTVLLAETSSRCGRTERPATYVGIEPWTLGYHLTKVGPDKQSRTWLTGDNKVVAHEIGTRVREDEENQNATPWSSDHADRGAHVAFCDGHVKYFSQDSPLELLKALATRDGGETIDVD